MLLNIQKCPEQPSENYPAQNVNSTMATENQFTLSSEENSQFILSFFIYFVNIHGFKGKKLFQHGNASPRAGVGDEDGAKGRGS